MLAQGLVRLDERAADVAVLDQTLGERDPAGAREADRGRGAGVGHGHDDIRLDRGFLGEPLAHAHPRAVQLDAAELRIGPREVDELEDAKRARTCLLHRLGGLVAVLVHDDHLTRGELPFHLGAQEVERARLGGEQPVVLQPAECERADPVWVAEAHELPFGEKNGRECALDPAHRGGHRFFQRSLVPRDQRRDHFRVGGRAEPRALGEERRAELARVRQVAVMTERDGARAPLLNYWLRVRPVGRARRGVARVPDRDLAGQAAQLLLVEDLCDEAHVAERRDAPFIRDGDPGGLLAAVLQGEEPEVGEARDVAAGSVDPEDPAHQ